MESGSLIAMAICWFRKLFGLCSDTLKIVCLALMFLCLSSQAIFAQTTGKVCPVGADGIPRENGQPCTIPVEQQIKVYLDGKYTWLVEKERSYTFTSTPLKDSVHIRWTEACASAGANKVCVITINSETRIGVISGVPITLTATPDKGSKFVKWTGDYCSNSTNPVCTFTFETPGDSKKVNSQFDKMPKPVWKPLWRRE